MYKGYSHTFFLDHLGLPQSPIINGETLLMRAHYYKCITAHFFAVVCGNLNGKLSINHRALL